MKNKKQVSLTTILLRKIISEEVKKVILESSEKELKEDSVDLQIDSYFSDYESEAKKIKSEGIDFRQMTRRFLTEAEDEDKDEESKEGKKDSTEKKKLTAEDLDLENFAASVVRLIDNYDSLLEIRLTIAKRAVNFLLKNYEPSVMKEFKEILSDQHDIFVEHPEQADEPYLAPPADRALGPSGGGA